jgi:hypothetical protein
MPAGASKLVSYEFLHETDAEKTTQKYHMQVPDLEFPGQEKGTKTQLLKGEPGGGHPKNGQHLERAGKHGAGQKTELMPTWPKGHRRDTDTLGDLKN